MYSKEGMCCNERKRCTRVVLQILDQCVEAMHAEVPYLQERIWVLNSPSTSPSTQKANFSHAYKSPGELEDVVFSIKTLHLQTPPNLVKEEALDKAGHKE